MLSNETNRFSSFGITELILFSRIKQHNRLICSGVVCWLLCAVVWPLYATNAGMEQIRQISRPCEKHVRGKNRLHDRRTGINSKYSSLNTTTAQYIPCSSTARSTRPFFITQTYRLTFLHLHNMSIIPPPWYMIPPQACDLERIQAYPTMRVYGAGSRGRGQFRQYKGWGQLHDIKGWAMPYLPSDVVSS